MINGIPSVLVTFYRLLCIAVAFPPHFGVYVFALWAVLKAHGDSPGVLL